MTGVGEQGGGVDPRYHFCPSEFGVRAEADCLFHVVPVALEASVSYGGGTADGPDAILVAADELEAVYLGTQPGLAGVHIAQAVHCGRGVAVEDSLVELAKRVAVLLQAGRVPVVLGGEHTVTFGALVGVAEAMGVRAFGVVQFDAHADLRNEYGGDPMSHACVMRRAHEKLGMPVYQVGVRGISPEEVEYREAHGTGFVDGHEIGREGVPDVLLPEDFPEDVYVTFDIDALDASLMPATGTPSPGGLFWHHVTELLEKVAGGGENGKRRRIVGFDVVELAPMDGFHAADFTAASVVYALMHAVLVSRGDLPATG